MFTLCRILAVVAFVAGTLCAQEELDRAKLQDIMRRMRAGEAVTAEEKAYLERARKEMQKRPGGAPGAAPEPREKTGLVPLPELKDKYKGEDGGLYGGGSNEPSKAHAAAAKAAAEKIQPIDGKVVLVSIGMSNTTQEFSKFVPLVRKGGPLVVVDGAQGGKDAAAWASPDAQPWSVAEQRLRQAGATPEQVQIVWIKQALIQQGRHGEFPAHAKKLQEELAKIVKAARQRYPNLKLAYVSSRIYAGYARTNLNPEPYAYEGAFSVRWLIQDQMKGQNGLGYDQAPVLLWGPYLWGDGVTPRKDGIVWEQKDLAGDGTHPSASGQDKVAQMLLKFFANDPYVKSWFAR